MDNQQLEECDYDERYPTEQPDEEVQIITRACSNCLTGCMVPVLLLVAIWIILLAVARHQVQETDKPQPPTEQSK